MLSHTLDRNALLLSMGQMSVHVPAGGGTRKCLCRSRPCTCGGWTDALPWTLKGL